MGAEQIRLLGVLLSVLAAILLLLWIGPIGFLFLVLCVVAFWYAIGPGARRSTRAPAS